MKVIAKFAAASACAAALALPLTAPVSAGEKSEDIVVRSTAAMQQWQAEASADLNRALLREPISLKVQPNVSIVEVTFTAGADGRAENVKVLDGDGNWAARRAAKFAVKKLDTLDEVPVSNAENARFLAQVIFADNEEQRAEMTAKLKKSSSYRFADAETGETYILLGG